MHSHYTSGIVMSTGYGNRRSLDKEGRGHYIFYTKLCEGTLPIYEYQCTNCGRTVEEMQRITDEPLQKCPSCKGKLRRLISLSSFQLKGTGWYATDYKNNGKKDKVAKPAEKSAEKQEVKAEKKTEETSTA
jgi:putative FmdB family regulatory protein